MLNVYKYYQDAKSLPLYNEISSQMKLLDNYHNTWGRTVFAEDLSLIKNIISGSPKYALRYAENIIKGRWKEAEPYIMRSPYAYFYAKYVIKGRWVEAEENIMKDSYFAAEYSKYILKERWLEAESYIMKDEGEWEEYKDYFEIE